MQAILYHMNQEESRERDDRETRHLGSQQDIKSIKTQLDRLSGAVGELVTAFKGNDLGSEGILARVTSLEEEALQLRKQFDELTVAIAKKQMYLLAFVTTVGIVMGTIIKTIIDHIFKK